MAYIKSIKVYGLCSRPKPVELKFNRHLNVIYGQNGCGKTSLLRVLHSALYSTPLAPDEPFFEKAEVILYSEKYKCDILRTLDRKGQKSDRNVKYVQMEDGNLYPIQGEIAFHEQLALNEWVSDPITQNGKRFTHSYLPTTRLLEGFVKRLHMGRSEDRDFDEEEHLNRLFERGLTETWRRFYQDISAKINAAQQSGLSNIFHEVFSEPDTDDAITPLEQGSLHARVKSFLKRQTAGQTNIGSSSAFGKHLMRSPLLRRVSEQIKIVEEQIEHHLSPIEKLNAVLKSLLSKGKEIQFKHGEVVVHTASGTQIPVSKLSSGEKNLLKILIELFAIKDSTLIVDEPELSFHIDWQADLVRILRTLNPDAQLILATHSPEIVAAARENELFRI